MSISTYFRPNIHQNGPQILGVKTRGIALGGDWNLKLGRACVLLLHPLTLFTCNTSLEAFQGPFHKNEMISKTAEEVSNNQQK
jgi:hypothetical protein